MTEVAKKVARGRRERLEDVRLRVTRDQFKQTRQPPPRALAILAEHAVRQIVYEKDVAERAAAKKAEDEEKRIKEESERAVAAEDEVTKLPLAWTPVVQSLFGEMKIKINATGGYMLEVKSARDLGIARGTPLPIKVADSALQPNETKKGDHILILTQRDQYSLRVTTLYVGTEDKCRAAARDANATYLVNSMMERILQFGSAHVSLKTKTSTFSTARCRMRASSSCRTRRRRRTSRCPTCLRATRRMPRTPRPSTRCSIASRP